MARFSATEARVSNRAAIDRLQAGLDGLSERELDRASRRALVGVRRRFEPAAKRLIRASYNVKARDLGGKFRVRTYAEADSEYVGLDASTKALPLIEFGARWGGLKTPGATAQVRRGGRKVYRSAFIATIGGKRHVLARQLMGDGTGKRYPRNQLRRLTGPSPAQMVEGDDNANAAAIAAEVTGFLRTELSRQIALARGGK